MPSPSTKRKSRQISLEEFFENVKERGGRFYIPRVGPKTDIPEDVFINREIELKILHEKLDQASKIDDVGVVIPIVTPTGLGKSALLNVFSQRVMNQRDVRVWKLTARDLLEDKSIEQEITRLSTTDHIPKLVSLDHLEDIGDTTDFLGKLKYLVQNKWSRTLVCFATTDRFYQKTVKPIMEERVSYTVIFEEILELVKMKPLSPTDQKLAIKKWTESRCKEFFKRKLKLEQIIEEEALELLSAEYSIGEALQRLNEVFFEIANLDAFDRLPLGTVDFKRIPTKKIPKIIIATTHNENEVLKIRHGVTDSQEAFFLTLKDCQKIPRGLIKEILHNLEVIGLDDDFMAKALYHSQIIGRYKNRFKLKEEDLPLVGNSEKLTRKKAIQLLEESSLSEFLNLEHKDATSAGDYKKKVLKIFHRVPQLKATIGTECLISLLRSAGIEAISEQTKKSVRPDIIIPNKTQDLAIELTFINPNSKTSLKPYIGKKINTYYKNYLK